MITVEGINQQLSIFNVGSEDTITVHDIAEIICEEMCIKPKLRFTGGRRGWKGDVPLMLLDNSWLREHRSKPWHNSKSAVQMISQAVLREVNG